MDAIEAMEHLGETRFRVEGMDCGGCAGKIEQALTRLPGVSEVSASVLSGVVRVVHGPSASVAEMVRRIGALGFTVVEAPAPAGGGCGCGGTHGCSSASACHDHDHDHDHATCGSDSHPHLHGHAHGHSHGAAFDGSGPWWKSAQGRLILGAGGAVALAYLVGMLVPAVERPAFILAALVGLVPVARQAWAAARTGTVFSIEGLMTLSATGAIFIGAEAEAAAVVFLFLIGEALEGLAAGRARAGIRAMADLLPGQAYRESAQGEVVEVDAASLRRDDIIVVRPGDRLPADGVVLAGESSVNEAPVTGESVPRAKSVGEDVFAGTINGEGVLRVRVTADPSDNTIARIVRLVEEAQESKAPIDRFIDRFARAYTPGVVAFAAVVAVLPPLLGGEPWGEWIYKALAILLIGCPCALVISTPAAIASALSAGARRGLLMKGGAVLEALGRVTTVAFDKTGTLTRGVPRVTDVGGTVEVLRDAAALSVGSSHPLARAILDHAAAQGVTPEAAVGVQALPGRGVRGAVGDQTLFLGAPQAVADRLDPEAREALARLGREGKTVSVVADDQRVRGWVALRDEPRPDLEEGVNALRTLGVAMVVLTGDQSVAAHALAQPLGLEVRAELLPEDKVQLVRERQARGERVLVVGDGINDAPALAAAHVGLAMGGGTDVALETADGASLHARVADVAAMIRLSRRTLAIIRQNVAIALGLKAAFLVTTLLGVTGLWPAVIADSGATVLVTANALRLLRSQP